MSASTVNQARSLGAHTRVAAVGQSCPACRTGAVTERRPGRFHCTACGTIWLPQRRSFEYADSYPADRAHFDTAVAHCKQVTLQAWLRRLGTTLAGKRVLEIGFGGGATLDWMQDQSATVFGQEPVAANRVEAIRRGIPYDRVGADLRDFSGHAFDLVLYLDSFEHVLEPRSHLAALNELVAPGSRALLVLPVADCLSRHLLRRWWPHDIPDHWVFYSTPGLNALWREFGWRPVARFFPWKYLSARTIALHYKMKTGRLPPLGPLAELAVWLNFGERGLIFEKVAAT
jgi:SAM-dependent methyltransferase